MNRKARTVGAVGAVGVAAMLGLGAVAYACSAQAVITPNKSSAPVGAPVTGSGSAFNSSLVGRGTLVDIRWNSASAQPLVSVMPDSAGKISFSIEVPAVAPGHYSIVATQGDMVGRAPFQVVGSSTSGTGGGSTGSGDTNVSSGTEADSGTSQDNSGSTNTATNTAGHNNNSEANQTTGQTGQTASTADSSETSPSRTAAESATGSASPAAARSAARPSTANSAPIRSATASVPAGSPTAATPAAEPAEATAPAVAPETAAAEPKPVATVAGDLWSGFNSGSTPSLMPTPADSPSSTGSFAPGVALLGAGMVAMSAGLFVTVARRRRVLAETNY